MYLKALELQGFKSFPEKIRLTFERDITAIVGPNGSGKSNISDAILWVMGEQSSKTLRGGNMQDIIFGGTEKRSPLGFAQVSLVLDNTDNRFSIDTDEVTVTRRYYRSGESEYFINNASVRLRDINELLMDTGLGRDGYSIIGQGRIDEIISAKSNDRREIFEEAAGISKFRYRKEETERKLDRTQENLLRINDKISELEMQVEPLRKQSETAKKYLLLRDELRLLEISVWMENLDKLNSESSMLNDEYQRAQELVSDENKALEAIYADIEAISAKMQEQDVLAEAVRSKISVFEADEKDAKNNAALLQANLENTRDMIARIRKELNEQFDRDNNLELQIQENASYIEQLADGKRVSQSRIDSILKDIEQLCGSESELEDKIASFSAKVVGLNEQISSELLRKASLESAGIELEKQFKIAEEEREVQQERLSAEKSDAARRENDIKSAEAEAISLSNVVNGYRMRADARKKRVDELDEKSKKIKIELDTLDSRIKLLSDMEKNYEGYSRAVKSVMNGSRSGMLKGVHAPVINLVKTKDEFTLAIETALGGSMQNIVVDNEENAKSAIEYLRRSGDGRATFMPLSAIKGSLLKERGMDQIKGFIGIASNILEFDAKYTEIFYNLLGRTVVVDTLSNAIAAARNYGQRFRIVTLDGQIINAGGSMTGGSAIKNAGLLSRTNELQRDIAKRADLEARFKKALNEFSEAQRELDSTKYELDVAQSELRRFEDNILQKRSEASQHELLLQALSQSLSQTEDTLHGYSERSASIKEAMREIDEAVSDLQLSLSDIQNQIEKLTENHEELREKTDHLNEQLQRYRTDLASSEAEISAREKSLDELRQLKNVLFKDRDQKQSMIKELTAQTQDMLSAIKESEKHASIAKSKADEEKENFDKAISLKFEFETRRVQREKEVQDKNRSIVEAERSFSKIQQKKLAADMEEKQLTDKLWDNYELSRTAAERIRIDIGSIHKAGKRISELKRSISSLGTPNLGAIDEFERVNSRYTYLIEQRNDIETAKKELEQIVCDITAEMKNIFAKEFRAINDSFKTTFLELFGGGKATLELEDEDDILNCGIEIRVQPPGKTLKTLTLLSGGEKAFVAIALYFAILKVRPTPFCVMDEIETALDEYNVNRFAQYMRIMSGKTQFIAITHRRGTMEEADVLYGVTMQEKGVSCVLKIDLEDAEKKYRLS